MERIELITAREYWVEMIEHTTKKGFTDIELADTIVSKIEEALTIQRVSNCFGKDDLRHVYEDVDTDFKNFEDWFKEYTLPI